MNMIGENREALCVFHKTNFTGLLFHPPLPKRDHGGVNTLITQGLNSPRIPNHHLLPHAFVCVGFPPFFVIFAAHFLSAGGTRQNRVLSSWLFGWEFWQVNVVSVLCDSTFMQPVEEY